MNRDLPTFAAEFKVLDWCQALERVEGDSELLREIAALFLEELPALIADVRSAVEQGDPAILERAAHTLKGSVANFGAAPAFEASLALEQAGRARALDDSRQWLLRLEQALGELTPELAAVAVQ